MIRVDNIEACCLCFLPIDEVGFSYELDGTKIDVCIICATIERNYMIECTRYWHELQRRHPNIRDNVVANYNKEVKNDI